MSYSLKINGQTMEVDAAPETPLLWVLRDHLGLPFKVSRHRAAQRHDTAAE